MLRVCTESYRVLDWSEALYVSSDVYAHREVRNALIKDQYGKCCFCEARISSGPFGHVVHFRPNTRSRQDNTQPPHESGYFWLAYDWDNLLYACDLCARQDVGFPLEHSDQRATSPADPLNAEEPVLINPYRDDPTQHIEFAGRCAVPKSARGKAMISIYALTCAPRLEVREERLRFLNLLSDLKQVLSLSDNLFLEVIQNIERATQPSAPFAAMARSFCLFRCESPPRHLVDVRNLAANEVAQYAKRNPKAIFEIDPRQFEELIAEILASFGWEVQVTAATKDGGYDIFAISKDIAGVKTSWIVECKRYSPHRHVGIEIARALYGVKTDLGVANALLATTTHFTKGVHAFKASRYDFELRDLDGILQWIKQYKPNRDGSLYLNGQGLLLPTGV